MSALLLPAGYAPLCLLRHGAVQRGLWRDILALSGKHNAPARQCKILPRDRLLMLCPHHYSSWQEELPTLKPFMARVFVLFQVDVTEGDRDGDVGVILLLWLERDLF